MSKTVIQMAKEAGFPFNKFGLLQSDDNCEIDADQMLERLVELARADAIAAEREACAQVCESQPMRQDIDVREQCAAAIRARGNT